ncbi:DNA recombinase [Bacillus taeanensis]|uniref:DNA recombinase n=1 Tax=Bacillus taeanensis TaxID=273032 RepID=A0A366XVD4_9BACI|nr:DNA recombinase [Bacillus taeanensis]
MEMEKIYEIQRIKQVIQEFEGGEEHVIRTPQDAANIASQFIGEDDREIFFRYASEYKKSRCCCSSLSCWFVGCKYRACERSV